MKKILFLISILFLASCASDLQKLKSPNIKGKIDKSISIYFASELEKNYKFGSKSDLIKFNALKHESKKPVGFEKGGDWEQNIGQLSVAQFKAALDKAFVATKIVNKNIKKADRNSYLIVPSIVSQDIEINALSRSSIKIVYKIDVYNEDENLIYSKETVIKESGKYKGFGIVFIGPIPIMGKANLKPNESSMIFEAVSNGVENAINEMLKSNKL